jgi:hypothetical protein
MTTNAWVRGAINQNFGAVPTDLCIVCLWSAFGLALTGLLFGVGLGSEIAQALTAAG